VSFREGRLAVRKSFNAVVERNVEWDGAFETEPYEVGWASEAIFFVRSLAGGSEARAKVQITPDGMNWCDEGTEVRLPGEGEVTFCRVTNFGNWLRLVGETEKPIKVLVTLSLKE
jgi:hypothetical protein